MEIELTLNNRQELLHAATILETYQEDCAQDIDVNFTIILLRRMSCSDEKDAC